MSEPTTNIALAEEEEMSFLDHLEELRWHIIRSLIAIIIFAVVAFIFIRPIFDYVLLAPSRSDFWTYDLFCAFSEWVKLGDRFCLRPGSLDFQVLDITAQFMISIKSSAMIGLICAFPYLAWEIWRFIEPALYEEEKKNATNVVASVSFLFMVGILFGYFVLTPFSVNFFANYKISDLILNQFKITSYISLLTTITMAAGVMFELPVAVFILSKMGLLTPSIMRTYRKHAFVVILVIAAIITPADIWTQILVTVPVYFLYEVSVIISGRVERRRLAAEALSS